VDRASAFREALNIVHVDHLNTPRLVADATGTTVWRWDQQEPFGVSPPDKNPSGLGVFDFPLRHPGQYDDPETGLFYNYFRDCYDPVLGRYCQSDPIGLRGGINTYAYVHGNPLAYVDPTGEAAQVMVVGGLILLVGAARTVQTIFPATSTTALRRTS
jgi:RHS repeat-associated protein